MTVLIERVSNGYIVRYAGTTGVQDSMVLYSLDEVFTWLLGYFESRYGDDSQPIEHQGHVCIYRGGD